VIFRAPRERTGRAAERLAAVAGRPAGDVVSLGPAKPPSRPRDLAFERVLTAQAAEAGRVGSSVLIHFAEERAGAGHVRGAESRDFALEILEELADARNYGVWAAAQEMSRSDSDSQVLGEISDTLILIAQAFDAALRIRDRQAAA
jgi:hypothetical protein